MNNIQNYEGVNISKNYYTVNKKPNFKAIQAAQSCIKKTRPSIIHNPKSKKAMPTMKAVFFAILGFLGIGEVNKNGSKTPKTNMTAKSPDKKDTKIKGPKSTIYGREMIDKANRVMQYITSSPGFKASNFGYVLAGVGSRELQYGPVEMEDGSKATVNFCVHDYGDTVLGSLKTTILKIEDENGEWYATTKEEKSFNNKYGIVKELESSIAENKYKWGGFYNRTTLEIFDKKGNINNRMSCK